jgi:hypothetical protein
MLRKSKPGYSARRGVARHGVGHTLRNFAVAAVALVILLVLAGVAYTKFFNPPVPVQPTESSDQELRPPKAVKPAKPSETAKESAAVEMINTPVTPGMNSSVSVRTLPGSECTITVEYNKVPSTDSGLAPKIADEYGAVNWTWTVEPEVPLGKWPVKVTCKYNDKSAFVQAFVEVVKEMPATE